MAMTELGIIHKHVPAIQAAYIRFNLKQRLEIPLIFKELTEVIPPQDITGAPYVIIQFFSSYTEGFEVEVGFPVKHLIEAGRIRSKMFPAMEVLALVHQGPPETLRETKLKLHQFTHEHGLISDEFTREVYLDWQNPQGAIEAQFVIHNWNARFARNLERVLGKEKSGLVMQGVETIGLESGIPERFEWVKGAVERLNGLASEHEKYDAVSACAHVFPPGQLEKLRAVFADTRSRNDDPLAAVDAVLSFMQTDHGWGEKGQHRDGYTVYHTKNPADPEAFAKAQTPAEKRAAYCFCPIIRGRLDQGMPVTYCYCGAGWFRQQWETATGKPVTVEVLTSVLKGEDACKFAVHLAEDL